MTHKKRQRQEQGRRPCATEAETEGEPKLLRIDDATRSRERQGMVLPEPRGSQPTNTVSWTASFPNWRTGSFYCVTSANCWRFPMVPSGNSQCLCLLSSPVESAHCPHRQLLSRFPRARGRSRGVAAPGLGRTDLEGGRVVWPWAPATQAFPESVLLPVCPVGWTVACTPLGSE